MPTTNTRSPYHAGVASDFSHYGRDWYLLVTEQGQGYRAIAESYGITRNDGEPAGALVRRVVTQYARHYGLSLPNLRPQRRQHISTSTRTRRFGIEIECRRPSGCRRRPAGR